MLNSYRHNIYGNELLNEKLEYKTNAVLSGCFLTPFWEGASERLNLKFQTNSGIILWVNISMFSVLNCLISYYIQIILYLTRLRYCRL